MNVIIALSIVQSVGVSKKKNRVPLRDSIVVVHNLYHKLDHSAIDGVETTFAASVATAAIVATAV